MARLYPIGAPRPAFDHGQWGHFDAAADGGFDLPDELSDEMYSFHHRGKKVWETEDERSDRLHGDEMARRRDPANLFDAVERLVALGQRVGASQAGADDGEAPAAPKRAKAAAATE